MSDPYYLDIKLNQDLNIEFFYEFMLNYDLVLELHKALHPKDCISYGDWDGFKRHVFKNGGSFLFNKKFTKKKEYFEVSISFDLKLNSLDLLIENVQLDRLVTYKFIVKFLEFCKLNYPNMSFIEQQGFEEEIIYSKLSEKEFIDKYIYNIREVDYERMKNKSKKECSKSNNDLKWRDPVLLHNIKKHLYRYSRWKKKIPKLFEKDFSQEQNETK